MPFVSMKLIASPSVLLRVLVPIHTRVPSAARYGPLGIARPEEDDVQRVR